MLSPNNKCFLIRFFVVPSISERDKVGFSLLSRLPFPKATVAYKLNPFRDRFFGREIPHTSCLRLIGKVGVLDLELSVASMRMPMEKENSFCRRVVDAHFLGDLSQ